MISSSTHFDKFLIEHNEYIVSLKNKLNCFKTEADVIRMVRSVFHVLRDRLTIQHSFHILSNLPGFLKLYYIEGWKYHERPSGIHSTEVFYRKVEESYTQVGGKHQPTGKTTAEIVNIILNSLREYLDDAGVTKLLAELPLELHVLFEKEQ